MLIYQQSEPLGICQRISSKDIVRSLNLHSFLEDVRNNTRDFANSTGKG